MQTTQNLTTSRVTGFKRMVKVYGNEKAANAVQKLYDDGHIDQELANYLLSLIEAGYTLH